MSDVPTSVTQEHCTEYMRDTFVLDSKSVVSFLQSHFKDI